MRPHPHACECVPQIMESHVWKAGSGSYVFPDRVQTLVRRAFLAPGNNELVAFQARQLVEDLHRRRT
jgi:hypothetical protein